MCDCTGQGNIQLQNNSIHSRLFSNIQSLSMILRSFNRKGIGAVYVICSNYRNQIGSSLRSLLSVQVPLFLQFFTRVSNICKHRAVRRLNNRFTDPVSDGAHYWQFSKLSFLIGFLESNDSGAGKPRPLIWCFTAPPGKVLGS